jgi:tetratricopeptide (TPR) repeat protein
MTPLMLNPLTAPEARALLIEIAPRTEPVADQVCYLCGYLPLAIRAAGSLLALTVDLDPADYAAQLKDERTRLERLGTEGVEIGFEASFNLSYARLDSEAARVFRQLAVFPATFDAIAAEAVCSDPGHVHLSDLVRRSLVLYDSSTKRYRLHDLARLFADSHLSEAERAEAQRLNATHYQTVLAAADKLYVAGGESMTRGLAALDLERANIDAGHSWAEVEGTTDQDAAKLCFTYPDSGVYVLNLRQHPRERIRWSEVALAAARRLKDRVREGYALGNLGTAYEALGEPRQAIELYDQRLKIAREMRDRRGENNALGNLGNAHLFLGETRQAIEFYERHLEIARETGDRRGEAADLTNLGIAHVRLGETQRAVELSKQAVVIHRGIGDRLGEAYALNTLGNAYFNLEENSQAIEFYEQYLEITREIGDRRGEGVALSNLGNVHMITGETERAIEFYEQALTIGREIGDRRGEGNALFNKSLALDKSGERAQAIASAEQALAILEEIEEPRAAQVRARLAPWPASE